MDVEIGGVARGPLAGIRILDLSAVVSGPLCTQVLGDLGAEVIKLEAPRGDTTRWMGPPVKGGLSGWFSQFNRNKRSIAIDLKTAEGQEVARRLAREADVVVENFRPGVAERLGVGYEKLVEENPALIYVAITGFGPEGPYRDLPAYDTVIQGIAGFMPSQGGSGTPQLVRSIVADKASALTAVYAVMAALLARERGDGRGQRIDIPMLDAFAAFMLPDVFTAETFVPKEGPELPFSPADLHRTWETADGYVVLLVLEDRQFQALCRALDREDMIDDPRGANLLQRIQHAGELFPMLEEAIKKWPTRELIERARRFGAPVAPVNGIEEFLADPQVAANRTVFETEDSEAGRLRLFRNPVRFARTPTSLRRHPPRLGEQTDEILREAGYDDAQIAKLRADGAVT